MIKIKIEGSGAHIAATLIAKALREAGLKVNYWYELTPSQVSEARRDATRCADDVSIVSMTR